MRTKTLIWAKDEEEASRCSEARWEWIMRSEDRSWAFLGGFWRFWVFWKSIVFLPGETIQCPEPGKQKNQISIVDPRLPRLCHYQSHSVIQARSVSPREWGACIESVLSHGSRECTEYLKNGPRSTGGGKAGKERRRTREEEGKGSCSQSGVRVSRYASQIRKRGQIGLNQA